MGLHNIEIGLCTFDWVRGLFHPSDTCGADFLPSGTQSSGSTSSGVQVLLSPAFAGCGRLMGYNVTANCPDNGNQMCTIAFQLWRPTESGHLTLVNSTSTGYNPESNNLEQESLSFSLDIEFTVGDMVGFFHDRSNPLNVHTASAGTHSYLQWSSVSTMRSVLTTGDATTTTSHLPILNVEGNHTHVMPTLHLATSPTLACLTSLCCRYLSSLSIQFSNSICQCADV